MNVPYSQELERGLLGCLLAKPAEAVSEFVAAYQAGAQLFWDDRNRALFETVATMVDNNIPVDQITVEHELGKNKSLKLCGGHEHITQVFDSISEGGGVTYFADQLLDLHIDRQLMTVGQSIAGLSQQKKGRLALAEAEEAVLAIGLNNGADGDTDIRQLVAAALVRFDEYAQRKCKLNGLATGLFDLDSKLHGMREGQLLIVAARPSKGKTSLAMNIVERVAVIDQLPVGVFSMEMSKDELIERMVSSLSKVPFHRIMSGTCQGPNLVDIRNAATAIAKSKIKINDQSGLSITTLRAAARRLVQRHKIVLLVIDYIQLMTGTGKRENRTQEVSEISRGLKAMAKELKIPVLALSQLNRSSETDDRPPRLSDLRESGSIEQDADVVIFIHDKKGDDVDHIREVELLVKKNRSGPTGTVSAVFMRDHFRFESSTP